MPTTEGYLGKPCLLLCGAFVLTLCIAKFSSSHDYNLMIRVVLTLVITSSRLEAWGGLRHECLTVALFVVRLSCLIAQLSGYRVSMCLSVVQILKAKV